jgi:hypothetical protein
MQAGTLTGPELLAVGNQPRSLSPARPLHCSVSRVSCRCHASFDLCVCACTNSQVRKSRAHTRYGNDSHLHGWSHHTH